MMFKLTNDELKNGKQQSFPLAPCVVVTFSLKKKQLLNLFSASIASPVLYSFDVIAAPTQPSIITGGA